MLTVIVPEAANYDEILAEVLEDGFVHNGTTYYPDGEGGLHLTPEKAADKIFEILSINRKLWMDFAESISR